MSGDFILAQLSDTHVTAGAHANGVDTGANLRRALAEIGAFRPDAILISGDLANDARAEEYEVLASILRDIDTPLFVLPGNHDDRALLRQAFGAGGRWGGASAHLSYSVEDFPLRLVCVDQMSPGDTFGVFTPDLAEWLDETLALAPQKPTIVALHHPPFLSHDRLFDRIGLRQADEFARIVAKHQQIIRIICGHHHRAVLGQVAHAAVVCAPSTAWEYGLAVHEDQAIGRKQPAPGWALHIWRGGALATHIIAL